MSLSTTVNKVIHLGNGLATSFSYTFPIQVAADLVVIFTDASGVETTLTPSQYSVTGIGTPIGGAVTYPLTGSPIATGTSLTILRTVDQTQPTVLSNQGGYFPEVVEAALDRIVMIEQQLNEKIGRALVTPVTDASPAAIPQDAAARANTALLFDALGNPYAGALASDLSGVSPFILANFLPAADAGAARTVLEITNANLGAIGAIRQQSFTGSGTYTPHANMLYCIIECVGGGGGGGGATSSAGNVTAGGGGGGGEYAFKVATAADIGVSKAVTIGAAGTAGANTGGNGGNGGNTSVGVLCVANGGAGGPGQTVAGNATAGGAGGTGGTGNPTIAGQPGEYSIEAGITTVNLRSGAGGSSGKSFGFGAAGVSGAGGLGVAGAAGQNYGGGGSGGFSPNAAGNVAGGAGAAGFVIVTEYCSS